MTRYVYPVHLSHDESGRVLVEFPDFDFAVTDGADVTDALIQAGDCLEEALAICIDDSLAIPEPSTPDGCWVTTVVPGPVIAAKAALYEAMLSKAGMTKVALAARLGVGEKEVRRMLDPRYATKIPALARALAALGKRIEITVDDAPRDIVDMGMLDADIAETRRLDARALPNPPSPESTTAKARAIFLGRGKKTA